MSFDVSFLLPVTNSGSKVKKVYSMLYLPQLLWSLIQEICVPGQ